jgi:c-di-GMP-binding flagellar brake protein YcgR
MMRAEEKRKLERFDLKIPAKIAAVTGEEERETLDLMTSDICAGGAFFHTDTPLPEGTQVRIDLVLPLEKLRKLAADCDHAYIKVTGTVLRKESKGMAICFDKGYEIRPHSKGGKRIRH